LLAQPCASQSIQAFPKPGLRRARTSSSISPCPILLFCRGAPASVRWPVSSIISHLAGIPSATTLFRGPGAGFGPVGDLVANPSLCKRPQTQQATVAGPAGQLLALVARPRQLQRRAQFHAAPDYFALFQVNHKR